MFPLKLPIGQIKDTWGCQVIVNIVAKQNQRNNILFVGDFNWNKENWGILEIEECTWGEVTVSDRANLWHNG